MRAALLLATAGLGSVLLAQEAQTPRFRVAVDAVRIDAVVTDKDGNIVRDLTADDFEILQDKKRQKVTFAQFVPVSVTPARPASPAMLKSNNVVGAPPLPGTAPIQRQNIQRTIALVVDDLGMSQDSLYYVKRSLHTFIDKSTQPGDLIAVVRTGGSMDGLQPFTTDRRVLHAAIDNLKYNAFSRSGVEAFESVNEFTVLSMPGRSNIVTGDFSALESIRSTVSAAGTLGALNLVIQGAQSLPGRKAILFVSEGFTLLEDEGGPVASPGRTRKALDRAVDHATRAGVVV
jgi:VWFA-related protein